MPLHPNDTSFMTEALRLAKQGAGRTWPNPMVGAVIVRDGHIVGRGFHEKTGEPHAEVHAIRDAGDEARGATCYVTLEPCCHQGRTGPCTEALISAGLKRVVYATVDPFPEVSGQGLKKLTDAGIEVDGPLLEAESKQLNAPFLLAQKERRPFVTLKLALSIDGMIADTSGNSSWITSEKARTEGHKLRALNQAVLIGAETLRRDNPRLTPRERGIIGRPNPIRVVLTNGQLNLKDKAIMNDIEEHPVWILTTPKGAQSESMEWAKSFGVEVFAIPTTSEGTIDLPLALRSLWEKDIVALFCEGGATLAGNLMREDLVDRLHIFRAPITLGGAAGLPGIADLGINGLSEAKKYRRVGLAEHPPDIEEILEREKPLW